MLLECARNVPDLPAGAPLRWCTYRFDRFTVDVRTRQLLSSGLEIHLSPKAFDLLRCLIENRARAVSRQELHQALWPSTFVLDANIASLVAEIRRALDDDAATPRFVRTMHRFGNRFVAQVRRAPMTAVQEPGAAYCLVWDRGMFPLPQGPLDREGSGRVGLDRRAGRLAASCADPD